MASSSSSSSLLSSSQQIAIAIIPKISSFISILAQIWIIAEVIYSKKKQCNSYHRLLAGLSIASMFRSIAFFASTWPIPKQQQQQEEYAFALGEKNSTIPCNIQGFLLQFGLASPIYMAMISFYYWLTIRWGWSEHSMKKKLEIWFHILPWTIGIGTATVGWILNLYQPANLYCWIGGSDNEYELYRLVLYYGPLWISFGFMIYFFATLYLGIRNEEIKTLRYRHPQLFMEYYQKYQRQMGEEEEEEQRRRQRQQQQQHQQTEDEQIDEEQQQQAGQMESAELLANSSSINEEEEWPSSPLSLPASSPNTSQNNSHDTNKESIKSPQHLVTNPANSNQATTMTTTTTADTMTTTTTTTSSDAAVPNSSYNDTTSSSSSSPNTPQNDTDDNENKNKEPLVPQSLPINPTNHKHTTTTTNKSASTTTSDAETTNNTTTSPTRPRIIPQQQQQPSSLPPRQQQFFRRRPRRNSKMNAFIRTLSVLSTSASTLSMMARTNNNNNNKEEGNSDTPVTATRSRSSYERQKITKQIWKQHPEAHLLTVQVSSQVFWYVFVFIIAHHSGSVYRLLQSLQNNDDQSAYFGLMVVVAILHPLQGFLDFCVYRRPIFLRLRKQQQQQQNNNTAINTNHTSIIPILWKTIQWPGIEGNPNYINSNNNFWNRQRQQQEQQQNAAAAAVAAATSSSSPPLQSPLPSWGYANTNNANIHNSRYSSHEQDPFGALDSGSSDEDCFVPATATSVTSMDSDNNINRGRMRRLHPSEEQRLFVAGGGGGGYSTTPASLSTTSQSSSTHSGRIMMMDTISQGEFKQQPPLRLSRHSTRTHSGSASSSGGGSFSSGGGSSSYTSRRKSSTTSARSSDRRQNSLPQIREDQELMNQNNNKNNNPNNNDNDDDNNNNASTLEMEMSAAMKAIMESDGYDNIVQDNDEENIYMDHDGDDISIITTEEIFDACMNRGRMLQRLSDLDIIEEVREWISMDVIQQRQRRLGRQLSLPASMPNSHHYNGAFLPSVPEHYFHHSHNDVDRRHHHHHESSNPLFSTMANSIQNVRRSAPARIPMSGHDRIGGTLTRLFHGNVTDTNAGAASNNENHEGTTVNIPHPLPLKPHQTV